MFDCPSPLAVYLLLVSELPPLSVSHNCPVFTHHILFLLPFHVRRVPGLAEADMGAPRVASSLLSPERTCRCPSLPPRRPQGLLSLEASQDLEPPQQSISISLPRNSVSHESCAPRHSSTLPICSLHHRSLASCCHWNDLFQSTPRSHESPSPMAPLGLHKVCLASGSFGSSYLKLHLGCRRHHDPPVPHLLDLLSLNAHFTLTL